MAGYEIRNYAQGDGLYTEQIQGGATVARYQLVYADATGRWVEADADAVATMPVLGLATQPLRLGQKGRVLIQGFANYNVWAWTPGGVLYADTVTGDLTQTPPAGATDIIQEVGVAFTATLIYFDGAGLGRSASGGTFLGDVDIFGTLTVDIINEHTLNAGVTIEGVILENGGITIPTLTATRVPFAGAGGLLTDDADLTFITDTLTVTKLQSGTSLLSGTGDVWSLGAGDSFGATNFSGQVGNVAQVTTLGAGAVTLAITKNFIVLTGDGGGNVLATITGGVAGQIIKILFTGVLVTITDTDAVTADTINLQSAFGSAANATLTLVHNGTKWFEVSRSPIGPVPAAAKVYDITKADTVEYTVALPAICPANTKSITIRAVRMGGTGNFTIRSVPGVAGFQVQNGGFGTWFRAADGLFYYNLTVNNDDWDIYIMGYNTG